LKKERVEQETDNRTGRCRFRTFPEPLAAKDALFSRYRAIADRRNFAVVRAGMHIGAALVRANRHFGSTVNLAGRVAVQATGGQILCTKQVADTLTGARFPDVEIGHRGSFSPRKPPQPVDLYEVVPSGCARQYAIDPVCKMQVDKARAAGDLRFGKRSYWFCSLACVERFATQPLSYMPAATK
jgi:class 3 adenylate cyclase/YHS domain-containing protein